MSEYRRSELVVFVYLVGKPMSLYGRGLAWRRVCPRSISQWIEFLFGGEFLVPSKAARSDTFVPPQPSRNSLGHSVGGASQVDSPIPITKYNLFLIFNFNNIRLEVEGTASSATGG